MEVSMESESMSKVDENQDEDRDCEADMSNDIANQRTVSFIINVSNGASPIPSWRRR